MAEKPEKEQSERRVYVLPSELVERIREYQESQSIPSEVEAVRRLLDAALQMRDSVFSVLTKLGARSTSEKDLRILSRDVLATHPLVKEIRISDAGLTFTMANGDKGRITSQLKLFWDASGGFGDTDWKSWPPEEKTSSHLDDDIPF